MKYAVIILFALLSGCNGSDTDFQKPNKDVLYDDTALKTQILTLSQALADATHIQALQAQQLSQLQFIGKLTTQTSDRMTREVTNMITPTFGICSNMGVYQGRGGSDTTDPLRSQYEIYKTTGCSSNNGTFASYNEATGLHDIPPYMAWDGPNCTGNLYIETDVPQNTFAAAVDAGGVVFRNPLDGLAYWMKGGQTPQPIMIQSAVNTGPGSTGCGVDIETRMAILAIRNDVTQSGIPDSLTPGSWSTVAP